VSSFFFERSSAEDPGEEWVFRLYIAGSSPHSQRAVKNLGAIVAECLGGRCSMQVIDVLEDPAVAIEQDIIVAPTLVRLSPLPEIRIVGNLNDRERVLFLLGLIPAG
jgi:circadian clock protein KaiB